MINDYAGIREVLVLLLLNDIKLNSSSLFDKFRF
ncbi:hypothetical protein FITA111629_07365 [Filibacter tadaridae]